ncbi:MFS transporter [Peptoniphilus sp. KCTC 25270]|uniref:MFS transporter n=1 Tax=Peptoniphilus sp. KCTC 25270 TaxID=2897414 RepID=UPI001E621EAC|nr:MFS transporter [Peptoniphilus sp. KCTC 25270]MCD1147472.1 MFS transporter [Peptoniphilus sp. KCTC 25270]
MNSLNKNSIFTRDIRILMLASFFYMASPMLVTPLITGFSETLGASGWIMGLVGGLTNLCSLLFQPFAGGWADRESKYKLGCIGVGFLILACLGYVLSKTAKMVLIFRMINGIGFAFCSVCFSTWIANLLPSDRIGYGMGLYGMMNALAMAIAPGVGVFLYQRVGYHWAFGAATFFAIVCMILIQFCQDKGEAFEGAEIKNRKWELLDVRVLPVALVVLFFALPYCATQSFIVRYAETKQLNITVSLFFTLYAMALLTSRILLRNWFDKWSYHKFLGIGSLCALASLYFLGTMENNGELFLGALFMAGGYGIMCTVSQSKAITLVEPEKRGIANGTYYMGLNAGMAFGPFLGGVLYGQFPIQWFYPLLMCTVPIGLLLYWVVGKMVKGKKEV